MNRARHLSGNVQTNRDRKGEAGEKQSQERVRHCHKEFVLAGQISHPAYRYDVLRRVLENTRRFRTELWRQSNWLLHHDKALSHTLFLTMEFFTKNNMTVIRHQPYSPDFTPGDFSVSLIDGTAILTCLR
jgi:hypothetical protein